MATLLTQRRADFNDPREHLAWTYPGMKLTDGSGLMLHPDTMGDWSEHQFKCGMRHHPELQEIERHPPRRGDDHWLNPTGIWVPLGTPPPSNLTAPDITEFTPSENADMLEQMARNGVLPPEIVEHMIAEGVIRTENLAPQALRRDGAPYIDFSALDDSEQPPHEKEPPKPPKRVTVGDVRRAARKTTAKKAPAKKAAPKKKPPK